MSIKLIEHTLQILALKYKYEVMKHKKKQILMEMQQLIAEAKGVLTLEDYLK
jgi:hypothetical protein